MSPDYEFATNAAYQELEHYEGSFPKIDVFELLSKDKNIVLKSYTQAADFLHCSHNEFAYSIAQSEHGFTVSDIVSNRHIIYFNNLKDEKTIRFTLMHELGHIRLGHITDDSISDREANCFARNILCPIQLVDEFKLSTAEDYVECFGISLPMAKASLANYQSDFYYIKKDLYQSVNDKVYCYMTGYTLSELYS
jgi:hypothetical protein